MAKILLFLALIPALLALKIAHAEDLVANVPIPIPTETAQWIKNLKCSDIVGADNRAKMINMLPFSMWLHGYLTGLGSSLPLDHVPAKKFELFSWTSLPELDALVITSCSYNKDNNAFDTAIDIVAMAVNVSSGKIVKLRGADGKWE